MRAALHILIKCVIIKIQHYNNDIDATVQQNAVLYLTY